MIFITMVFVEGLGARYIELGDDFRFGNSREGDFEYAQQFAEQYNYQVERTETVTIDGARVSSTRIREALLAGDFAERRTITRSLIYTDRPSGVWPAAGPYLRLPDRQHSH